jgi:hypothetical protein
MPPLETLCPALEEKEKPRIAQIERPDFRVRRSPDAKLVLSSLNPWNLRNLWFLC